MQPSILSLDIGTSNVKSVLFDTHGHEVAVSEQALTLQTPQPGFAELDPDQLFSAVLGVITETVSQLPGHLHILSAVLSAQGGSLLPVDAGGTPLCPIITWLDQRASPLVRQWQEQGLDQWIRKHSGWPLQPGLPLPVICSIRQNQPGLFSSTSKFLSINDFIINRLTGIYATSPSMAGEMLLTDVHTGSYSQELCELAGIHTTQLSPIQPSDTICGTILNEIASRTRLPADLPLINGGQDHSCEALALGLTDPGSFMLACGTAWVINAVSDSPEMDALPPRMALNPHVLPDRWIASEFLGGLGACMDWYLSQLWKPHKQTRTSRSSSYAAFNAGLDQTSPGCGPVFLPVSGIPRTGRFDGGYVNLHLDHSRTDMGRAVLESAAFELRSALERATSSGLPVETLWMVGGATRNPHWPQIIADAANTTIHLTRCSHGPALGAAVLAAQSLELIESRPDWVSAKIIAPDQNLTSLYNDLYNSYIHLTRDFPG